MTCRVATLVRPDSVFVTRGACETMSFRDWSQRLRIRLQKGFFTSILGLTLLGIVFAVVLTTAGIYTYYYVKYSQDD